MRCDRAMFMAIATIQIVATLSGCSDTIVSESRSDILTCEITTPKSGTTYALGDTIEIPVNASNGNGEIVHVRFIIDGEIVFRDEEPPYVMRWPTANESSGVHTIIAIARDVDGDCVADTVVIAVGYQYTVPENTGDGWVTGTLENVGLDRQPYLDLMNALNDHQGHLVHGILVIRHSKLVFEEYFEGLAHPTWGETPVTFHRDTLHVLSSVSKSITSALLGIAIDRGFLSGEDQEVLDLYPELSDLNTGPRQLITLKHLITMGSGLEWDEEALPIGHPDNDLARFIDEALNTNNDLVRFVMARDMASPAGTAFNYSGGNTNVIGDVISRTSGQRLDEFANTYLLEPLGIESGWCWLLRPDFVYASGDYALRPRDAAKFGQLFLQDGSWNGVRVVSEEWVDKSSRKVFPLAVPPQTITPDMEGHGSRSVPFTARGRLPA